MESKSEQLQIRVTKDQKEALKLLSKQSGLSISEYVLSRVLPKEINKLQELARNATSSDPSFPLAEISDILFRLSDEVLSTLPIIEGSKFTQAYIASMIQYACNKRNISSPKWTAKIPPLEVPYFGSSLMSLRPYLLSASLPEFKARNIFIDSSVGERV